MGSLRRSVRTLLVELAHLARARSRHRFVVLLYHRVLPAPPPDDPWALSVTAFERQLELLAKANFLDIALDELETSRSTPKERRVLIAFDDGYRSVVDFALPVLRSAGRRAAFFLVPGAFNGVSDWERPLGLEPSRILGWGEAKQLLVDGMCIGSHSMTHADLSRSNEHSIEAEIVGSKALLEHELGVAIRSFGVPYGRDDGRVDRHLRAAGYLCKFTNPVAASRRSDLTLYPVRSVLQRDTLRDLRRRLSGADELIWSYYRLRERLGLRFAG